MLIVGIVGGIASGKSLVAACFEKLGAAVLDADRAGHIVLEQEPVRAAIRKNWGDSVFSDQGQVDRKKLGQIVFASQGGKEELSKLEQITHPRIRQELEKEIEHLRATGMHPVVILDAPVMLKAGWDQICDLILFVESSDEARLERAKQRGWSAAELARRESAQVPLVEKRLRADTTIQNNGSIDLLESQTENLWRGWITGETNST